MSVKIVHAADFHLDSAFGALSAEQARQRRRESRELLTRLSNYVNQNGVDLVLLAGDLFDSDTTYRETLEALSDALGAMQARVFIAPGNHDPYSAKSAYATLSWPENVHVGMKGSTRYYWDIRLAGLTVFIAAQTVILATAIF